MYKATDKSPAIAAFLDKLSGRTFAIANSLCTTCGASIEGFRDALSEREYRISGMCQGCQDSVFTEEDS